MSNEQTHTTKETIPSEKTEQEIGADINAEQTKSEESWTTSGQEKSEQVDFSQMYDMLKERDETINKLKSEVSELKKSNTQLILKVNSSSSGDGSTKNPYESFVDLMEKR